MAAFMELYLIGRLNTPGILNLSSPQQFNFPYFREESQGANLQLLSGSCIFYKLKKFRQLA